MGLTATIWFVFGFGLAFGESAGHVIGNPASFPLFLNMDPCTPAGYPMSTGLRVPALLFAGYQMMFGRLPPTPHPPHPLAITSESLAPPGASGGGRAQWAGGGGVG